MEERKEEERQSFLKLLACKFDIREEVLTQVVEQSEELVPFLKNVDDFIREKNNQEDLVRQEVGTLRRQRLNAEHQLSQLEKQLISCNTKLDKESKELEEVKERLSEAEQDAANKKSSLDTVTKESEKKLSELEKLSVTKKQLEEEKKDLLELVEKKNVEIDRLNDEWKAISERAAAANKSKLEAQEKLDEIQSQDITREFKTKRLEQEKHILSQQLERLNEEMKSKTDEIVALKKDKNAELIDIKSKLEDKDQEVTHLRSTSEACKRANVEQVKRIESLMERLKNSRENATETENHLQQELSAKSRLVTLYKDSAEDGKKKIAEMTTALEEMQRLCKEATEAKTSAESKATADRTVFEKDLSERDERIAALENELKNANDLLAVTRKREKIVTEEALEEMSPSAAATSALLKKGMTLTQIYSEFVKVSDALEDEKDENSRLKQYMEQILQEIEEKSPLLKQQKEDYEQSLISIDSLTRKLDSNMKELQDLRGRCLEHKKKSDFLKRENSRLSDLSSDLSRQVRYLLKECEEARGGVVSTEQQTISELSSHNVSSSSQVISEHLVTFGTIEELQAQNQKLLGVVRELAEENEKEENAKTKEKLEELQGKFDIAMEHVEEMKEDRKRQEDLVQTLVRQRDMYKVLYASGPKEQMESSTIQEKTMQSPTLRRRSSLSLETELNRSRAAHDSISEQLEEFKKNAAKKEQSQLEECEKLGTQISTLKIENQKLKSALEFSEERHKLVQTSVDGYSKESAALQEKCRSITIAMGKAQSEAAHYKQELETCREKMIAAEVSAKTLEAEKKMIKDAEQRLLDENKSLLEQQRSQNSLLTNLQTIQNSLERQEFETRSKLSGQVEQLQQELKAFKRKYEAGEKENQISLTLHERKVKELSDKLKAEIKEKEEANSEIIKSKGENMSMTQRVTELEKQLKASEERLKSHLERENEEDTVAKFRKMEDSLKDRIKELERKVSDAEKQRQGITSQLTQARKHLIQYKEIAAANETAMQDQKKAYDEYKEETEKKLDQAEKQLKDLRAKLTSAESAKKAIGQRLSSLEKEAKTTREESDSKIKSLQFDLDQTKEKLKSAQQQEKTARQDFAGQLKVAKETQDKYERELVLHAKDVESLVQTKEQLKEYNTTKETLEATIQELEGKLKATEEVLSGFKKHQEEEVSKLNARVKDLVDQNTILHSQVERLSNELTEAKAKPVTIELPLRSSGAQGDQKTAEELYEVIRYIRREKEIAETKNEVAQSESIRYRQRAEFLESELEDTKKALDMEQRRTQGHMMTTEEHKEITEKVEKLKQVTETNKELEKQKVNLERGNLFLRGKVKNLEGELTSLKDGKKRTEDERDALMAEKTTLKNEIQRWTTKNRELMEQNAKLDHSKELENLQKIKSHNERIISALKLDNQRSKDQIENISKELTKVRSELQEQQNKAKQFQGLAETAKTDKEGTAEKLNQEVDKLKKVIEEKTAEVAEKTKLNTQLRKLAKKYKTQSDELLKGKAEAGTLTAAASANAESLELLETAQENQRELSAKLEQAQKSLKEYEQVSNEQETKVKELEQKVKDAEQKAGDTAQQLKESEQKIKQSEDVSKASSQRVSELENTISSLNRQLEELQNEDEKRKAGIKEKEEKNKRVMMALKSKVTSLTTYKDKITNENEGLKRKMKESQDRNESLEEEVEEKNMRISSLMSQYDLQVARLERELEEAREGTLKMKDDNEKLQQENRNIQKAFSDAKEAVRAAQAIEAQKQVRAYASSTQTAKVRAQATTKSVHQDISATEGSPLTATVRPTSSSNTNQTQKATAMPTASIRPIPVAPTPTAMVSPTVPLTQGDAPLASSASVSVTATVTATQRQADVVPSVGLLPSTHRRPSEGEPGISGLRHGSSSFKAPVNRATAQVQARDSQGMDIQIEGGDISGSGAQTPEGEDYEPGRQQTETPFFDIAQTHPTSSEAEPSQSSRERAEPGLHGQQHMIGKRIRLIEEYQEREEPGTSGDISDQPEAKRIRVQEIVDPQVSSVSSSASSETTAPSVHAVIAFEQDSEPSDDVLWGPKEEESQEYQEGVEQMIGLPEVGAVQDEDSVSAETGINEDRRSDPRETQRGSATATSAEPESSNEYTTGDSRQGESSHDQTDLSQRGREASAVSEGLRAQPVRRQPSPFGSDPAGRGRFLRSRYQLPSFSLPPGQAGSGGPFDDADDCTVPSTPTLYIPKRTDGFAEAVSSPQVRYPVFSFGGANDPSQVSSQQSALEVGDDGLRLDETRVELMGGEEPASVPNTPLGVVPSVSSAMIDTAPHGAEVAAHSISQGPILSSGRLPVMTSGIMMGMTQSGLDENSQEQNVPQQIDLTGDDEEDEDDVGDMEGGEDEEEDDDDANDDEIILVEENRDFSDLSDASGSSDRMDRDGDDNDSVDDEDNVGQGKDRESEDFQGAGDGMSQSRLTGERSAFASTMATRSGPGMGDIERQGAGSSGGHVQQDQTETSQSVQTHGVFTTAQRGRGIASRPRLRRTQLSGRGSRFKSAPQRYTPPKPGGNPEDDN